MSTKDERTIIVDVWYEEKVVHSLVEVAHAAHWVKRLESLKIDSRLSSDEREKYELLLDGVVSGIYAALYDLTKVASKLHEGKKWEWQDRDEIYENEERGLARVLDKYGLDGWLDYLRLRDLVYDPETGQKINEQEILRRVKELSKSPARENRTLIYVELRRIKHDSRARKLLDLIEPVTQGEKSWVDFQQEAREILKDI
jgi:hypothetical protein